MVCALQSDLPGRPVPALLYLYATNLPNNIFYQHIKDMFLLVFIQRTVSANVHRQHILFVFITIATYGN